MLTVILSFSSFLAWFYSWQCGWDVSGSELWCEYPYIFKVKPILNLKYKAVFSQSELNQSLFRWFILFKQTADVLTLVTGELERKLNQNTHLWHLCDKGMLKDLTGIGALEHRYSKQIST